MSVLPEFAAFGGALAVNGKARSRALFIDTESAGDSRQAKTTVKRFAGFPWG
jgi:hypothetical protein